MRKTLIRFLLCVITLGAFSACRTTEANYREAYQKALEARRNAAAVDSAVYGEIRRQMDMRTITLADGRQIEVMGLPVRVSEDGGGINENLRRYNVVVGRFKQFFNANSLRRRFADSSLPGAFVVETAEPYYYVIASSWNTPAEAQDALQALPQGLNLKAPLPFILDATVRRGRAPAK